MYHLAETVIHEHSWREQLETHLTFIFSRYWKENSNSFVPSALDEAHVEAPRRGAEFFKVATRFGILPISILTEFFNVINLHLVEEKCKWTW
jgi:hypothetical protein